ncbi:glycosyltransferase family 4 protein [Clostridium estertheticum]|uniref:glycosyltransferase family 4 protein n=1 Tax=Clostridium estertheticum TaxID=238834 RepID=UPI001C7E0B53|nr:glycosyltransferase family 1 protein [Clostridium estertheticum]MBX4266154.1 glycosyltransferase family 4 protein [Clostridium estertheticum]MBX4270360.1 glycosyltransferase family 4 protein [Clostridium estertheticum]WLC80899.1 glycosyltransferase family 4 protein [Clostridium estertheticum]WLC87960.1 glycosyltransferase family 4 protein [Clostridium estertheticum]
MKIGIDARAAKWYRGTGIGTYSYQLINSLNKIDNYNDYSLFVPNDCNLGIPFKNNFHINPIEQEKQDNFWNEVNISNPLLDKSIDIYHVPQNGIGLPISKDCPFVITLHDIIPYKMPDTVGDQYLKIFNEKLPKIIPMCDGIITVSEYSKEDIIKAFNFPREKIYVTYLASEDIYKPYDKTFSKSIVEKNYSIKGDYILYIGGFSPRKNILGLLDSFSMLLPRLKKDIKLVIAGSKGKSYDIYKKRAQALHIDDKVVFPGFISMNHIPFMYNACELFVYPSFYEGFGLPPIEAMACGIPVITSNVTSIPEIVKDSTLLVNPYDINELSEKMYNVLHDDLLRQSLITKGLKRASTLTWDNTAANTLIAYQNILNANKI